MLKLIVFLVLFSVIVSLPNISTVYAIESIQFNPIADAYVASDSPSSNYGSSTSLYVDFKDIPATESVRKNAYLLFNLTTLSKDVFAINSATLELNAKYSAFAPTTQVGVHLCSDTQWVENELTWFNAPSFSSELIEVTMVAHVQLGMSKWVSWNITKEVKSLQEGYMTLVLTVEGEGDNFNTDFGSKDNSNLPRLIINYDVIPEFPSWFIIPLGISATLVVSILKKRLTKNQ